MKTSKTRKTTASLSDQALMLAEKAIGALNERSLPIEGIEAGLSSSTIYEKIRKRVVRQIAHSHGASLDFSQLVDAYVLLLDQRLALNSGRYELVASGKEKRKRGVFYTPNWLARELAMKALAPLVYCDVADLAVDSKCSEKASNRLVSVEKMLSLTILDPAMGAGTFLLNSLEILSEFVVQKLANGDAESDWHALIHSLNECLPKSFGLAELKSMNENQLFSMVLHVVARRCLYGFDLDEAAVELSKLGLSLCCGLPSEGSNCFSNLKSGHALLDLWRSPVDIFPAVFSRENPGFDLVITNPPWEIEKVNSREFFSRFDPTFMSLSKQAAIERQKQILSQDKAVEEEWNEYRAYHENLGSFIQRRAKFQGGGDSNAYKLFLELGYDLCRVGGVMAQIVPSGIYSDKGATELRRLFVEKSRWLFLSGFHNHDGIFDIHRSFKFCMLGVVKGERTDSIECGFLRVASAEKEDSFKYRIATLKALSPENLAFFETTNAADLRLVEKLAATCKPLASMPVSFRREFDMTNDSKHFIERSVAQVEGFALDSFGHWLKGSWRPVEQVDTRHQDQFAFSPDGKTAIAIDDIKRVLLPVYEGRMIGQYDWAKKAWMHGKGRRAEWTELPFGEKHMLPQYLLDVDSYFQAQPDRGAKVGYLAVGASTNSRSCIAALIGDWPCGNAVPVLIPSSGDGEERNAFLSALLACLNSFVFDYFLRLRLSANNLNWFILQECLLPDLNQLALNKALLSAVSELSSHNALRAEGFGGHNPGAVRRLKLRAFIEAVVAQSYQISDSDCEVILRGCELADLRETKDKPSSIDKGFHRIDLELPPKFRSPSLFLEAFKLIRERDANWLFENLDADEVLFSKQSLDLPGSSAKRSETMTATAAATLMCRIRSAGSRLGFHR